MAADALVAVASCVERDLDRHASDYGISDAKLEVLELFPAARAGAPVSTHSAIGWA